MEDDLLPWKMIPTLVLLQLLLVYGRLLGYYIKVLTSLTKVQPNPISFCMDHGAYHGSWIGPLWAHEVL